MTDALWGVIIGGAVGVVGGTIGTIVQHHYAGKRWKKEAQLERLQRERYRMEKEFFDFAKRMRVLEVTGKVGSKEDFEEMVAFITLYFPKLLPGGSEVQGGAGSSLQVLKEAADGEKWGVMQGMIDKEMRAYLAGLDAKIDALLS